jgi:hypothetical protein
MFFLFKLKKLGPYKNNFKNLFSRVKQVAKYKFLEFEIYKYSDDLIRIQIEAMFKCQDHGGCSLEFTLFGYGTILRLYDSRHWDYDNNCWVKYD